ncbi:MAG TPA: translocation/assembly module TamB domain-containing protein [Terriglobales bacterium]|nr:translocation/assembly module TamB domain-containing protein [Terriglobales bacterium]
MAKWRKIIGWTAVTIGALLLFVVVAVVVALKTPALQRHLLATIQEKASAAIGSRVEIQSFDVRLRTLTVNVYGLTIHGTEPVSEKPLLQIQHATIGLKIISIFRHKVNLSELLIDRPIVNLLIDKAGQTNLPHPPPSQNKSSNTNIFDLAVGHVLLTDGEIDARDQKIPVDANLTDLRTEITFSQLQKKYSGTISYQNGLIQYENLRPLQHNLQASFDATPSELNLRPLVLNVGGSRVQLQATVRDYMTAPVANGQYDIALHTQDFAGLSTSAKPSGDVVLRGAVSYKDVPGQSMLRNASLSGNIDSNGLTLASPQALVRIKKIAGKYQLANGTLRADAFAFDLFDGELKANGTIQQIDTTRRSRFHLELAGISLQAVKASVRNSSSRSVPITGTLNAAADANWQGTLANLRATSGITVRGSVITSNKSEQRRFPLTADVHVAYDAPRSLLTVASSSIQLPATSISAQGTIGNNSNLTIHASSSDLHQLMLLASAMPSSDKSSSSSASSSGNSPYSNIRGAAALNAVVRGTLQNPQVNAQLSATNLQVNNSEWNSLQLAVTANPSQFSIQSASLVSAHQGQLTLNAQVGLKHWSYVASNPIAANVHIQQLQIDELQQMANVQYPVEGQIVGNVQLRGSELNPQGQGKIQINQAKISDEPVKTVSAQFRTANGIIQSNLVLGVIKADVSYTPKTKAYNLQLSTSPIDISKSHTVQAKNLPLKGIVSLTANGAGTVDDPQLTASVKIEQLQMRETTFSRVEADLNVANHLAKLALNSGIGGASLHGNATVRLSPGYYTEASLDTSKFAVDPFLAMYMPTRPPDLHGETEIHLSVRGPAADKSKLEAHLTIPVLSASYQSLQIAAASPIRADYAKSVLVLQPASIKGTDTSLQFQGRIPLNEPGAITFSAHGSVGMQLVQMFSPDLRTGGDIALNVNAGGTLKNPDVNGQIRLEKISFASEDMPIGVQDLNAVMQVSNTGVQITSGAGKLGGGEIKLGGSILYRPQLQMNVALSAKGVRVRYPEGVRTVFDSELTLSGNQQASLLQGRVLIDSLSFTSDFDISSFMSQFTGTSAPPTGKSMADNLKLQIAVQSTNQLSAGTAQLGLEGSANLRVIGTASNPVVIGRTDLTSADVFFDKNQYHLEHGVITFANPNQTTPVVNMLITTTISQYSLSITIRGPIEKLQTTYVSDPPLAPVDIINLIARGQTTTEGAPTSFGANEVLAAGLGQVSNEVTKLTGIAGLQIDPLVGGENSNPSARVGIQKRVTKNFLFTFSTDVTQPQSEIVQGEYQLTKRWSVSVLRNESGGFAIDGRFHTNF